jgi:hypothetical protein
LKPLYLYTLFSGPKGPSPNTCDLVRFVGRRHIYHVIAERLDDALHMARWELWSVDGAPGLLEYDSGNRWLTYAGWSFKPRFDCVGSPRRLSKAELEGLKDAH